MYSSSTTKVMALTVAAVASTGFTALACADSSGNPSDKIDLSHWNITLPLDADGDEKIDSVSVTDIQNYSHPDFFYLNDDDEMVFTAANKAMTTPNSSNTRSMLQLFPYTSGQYPCICRLHAGGRTIG